MPLTKAQREQRAVEEAYSRQTQALRPKPDLVSPCSKHPEYRVEVTGGRIPPSHEGTCPMCRDEVLERRDPPRQTTRKLDRSAGRAADLAYMLWREKHPSPQLEPGSLEESNALQAMAAARAEEEAREAAKGGSRGGRLVSARSEHNIWTEYWHVPGRGIVRVTG